MPEASRSCGRISQMKLLTQRNQHASAPRSPHESLLLRMRRTSGMGRIGPVSGGWIAAHLFLFTVGENGQFPRLAHLVDRRAPEVPPPARHHFMDDRLGCRTFRGVGDEAQLARAALPNSNAHPSLKPSDDASDTGVSKVNPARCDESQDFRGKLQRHDHTSGLEYGAC